ncbi:MAG: cyclic nucleotide-binding domain-containing protein [Chloroflexi bacterium]|nr:cyclic nucleotide-binding domain-containing protein [Chloroflexota bacterium]
MTPARSLLRNGSLLGAGLALVAVPLFGLYWLLGHPRQNLEILIPRDHFVIVTNVALLSLAVAAIVLRSAMLLRQARPLLLSMGFLSLAGLFSIHGLTTPGIIVQGHPDDYGGSATGVMAYLSTLTAAFLFAARDFLPASWRERLPAHPRLIALVTAGAVVLTGALALLQPSVVGSLGVATPPVAYASAVITISLLLYAAYHELRVFASTGYPTSATLALGFAWLAVAQACMTIAPAWTLAWWEYHVLMLTAVIVGLVGQFIELDRRRQLERFLAPSLVDRVLSGTATSLGGERREITILFADLRESTALEERIEPEEAAGRLNEFFEAMDQEIARFNGTLDKYLGDGLMALFGDRAPYEDHTQRAVRAAFAMQDRMRQLQRQSDERGQESLRIGIGIAHGMAMVGMSGSVARMEYTAIGSPVNIASRLTSLAASGQVLTTSRTYRRVEAQVEGIPKAAARVRGLDEPIRVVELVGLRSPRPRDERAGWSRLRDMIIEAGREPELRAALLADPHDGQRTRALDRTGRDLARRILELWELPLLSGIPDAEVKALLSRASLRDVRRGTAVLRQGEQPDAIYLVVQGTAHVLITDGDAEHHVATLTQGDLFGEIALLFDTARTATVHAESALALLAVARDDCYELLSQAPTLRERVEEIARARMSESVPERSWAARPQGS